MKLFKPSITRIIEEEQCGRDAALAVSSPERGSQVLVASGLLSVLWGALLAVMGQAYMASGRKLGERFKSFAPSSRIMSEGRLVCHTRLFEEDTAQVHWGEFSEC
jgi:hypothetical protein